MHSATKHSERFARVSASAQGHLARYSGGDGGGTAGGRRGDGGGMAGGRRGDGGGGANLGRLPTAAGRPARGGCGRGAALCPASATGTSHGLGATAAVATDTSRRRKPRLRPRGPQGVVLLERLVHVSRRHGRAAADVGEALGLEPEEGTERYQPLLRCVPRPPRSLASPPAPPYPTPLVPLPFFSPPSLPPSHPPSLPPSPSKPNGRGSSAHLAASSQDPAAGWAGLPV